MISVTQGPSINASLAALDFDKKFEAGREGIRVKAGAEEAKSERIRTAFDEMTDNFQKAQITGSKVAAAIEKNPELFAGLEDSNSLTGKSYKKFLDGDYSPQVVNNLNAYIDSAQTQMTNANEIQKQKDSKTAASALTDIIKLQFPEGMSDDDIDSVTQSDLTKTMLNYIGTKDLTEGAQALIMSGVQQYGQNLVSDGDFAYNAKIESNMKAFDAFSSAYLDGDTAGAMRAISTSPLYSKYINVEDVVSGEIIRQRTPDEIAAILGISKPSKPDVPTEDTGDDDTDAKDAALEALGTQDITDKKLKPYTDFKNKDLNNAITSEDQVRYANDLKDELKEITDSIEQYQKKIDDRNFQDINVGSGSSRMFSASGGYTVSIDRDYLDNRLLELKTRAVDIIGELDTMLKEDTTSALDTKSLVESAKLDAQ